MRALALVTALFSLFLVALSPGLAQQRWHGDYFPNVELTTQDGRKVRFYDDVLKGKVVAINFIFTTCPDVCPLDTAALRRVQKLVGPRMGKDVFFYSISIDPKNDTPAALKAYMKKFDVGPGWTFLTGRPEDIALIQRKFGIRPTANGMLSAHDTRYVLGNEKIARWLKRTPHDNPHVLAHILTRDLPGPGMRGNAPALPSYAEVRQTEKLPRGAKLFMTRCSACHTIGAGDGKLGPDLAGVTERRPRAWLLRQITEPDRMRAEKDPAKMALVSRYHGLAMPNLRITQAEAADLLDFIAGEGRRQQAGRSDRPDMAAKHDHRH